MTRADLDHVRRLANVPNAYASDANVASCLRLASGNRYRAAVLLLRLVRGPV